MNPNTLCLLCSESITLAYLDTLFLYNVQHNSILSMQAINMNLRAGGDGFNLILTLVHKPLQCECVLCRMMF